MTAHLTAEQLTGLVEGTLERPQARDAVAHLLRGCEPCGSLAAALFRPGRDLAEGVYDQAFERAAEALREHLPGRKARRHHLRIVPASLRPDVQL